MPTYWNIILSHPITEVRRRLTARECEQFKRQSSNGLKPTTGPARSLILDPDGKPAIYYISSKGTGYGYSFTITEAPVASATNQTTTVQNVLVSTASNHDQVEYEDDFVW
jgi:hypothetical protein